MISFRLENVNFEILHRWYTHPSRNGNEVELGNDQNHRGPMSRVDRAKMSYVLFRTIDLVSVFVIL